MTSPAYTCAHGGEPTELAADGKRVAIAFTLTGENAELVQEMMYDYRTTDPNHVARFALSLLAEMKRRGKFLVPDEFDDWGNNMVHVYGVES